MTPVTVFPNAEAMYRGLAQLVYSHPEYKHFDNGAWRVIEIPPEIPSVNEEAVFVIMEYYAVDVWDEHQRWLVIASDGEHPDGYSSLDEAMQVLARHGVTPHRADADTTKIDRIAAYAVRRPSARWTARKSDHMRAHLSYIAHEDYPRLIRLVRLWQRWMQKRMYGPALNMLAGQCESLYCRIYETFCSFGDMPSEV
jgi:hypothetical protein